MHQNLETRPLQYKISIRDKTFFAAAADIFRDMSLAIVATLKRNTNPNQLKRIHQKLETLPHQISSANKIQVKFSSEILGRYFMLWWMP